MKPTHAIEIALTRPASDAEVDDLAGRAPGRYAFTHDRLRATTVVAAATEAAAAGFAFWQTAGHGLPVDAAWSLHPDRNGLVQVVVDLDDAVEAQLRERAAAVGQTLSVFLAELLREAVALDTRRRQARLRAQLTEALQQCTPEDLLQLLHATPAGSD